MAKAKDRSRKRPLRKQRRPIDDDLVDIALALDEQRLDKNASGWFGTPWRDGWNALGLAIEMAQKFGLQRERPHAVLKLDTSRVLAQLCARLNSREVSAQAYWEAGEVLEARMVGPYTRAALRIYQIIIARSDAGGEIYNQILRSTFESTATEHLEPVVEFWRMRDALGANQNERRRRAFLIAWNRGLFAAAYAV